MTRFCKNEDCPSSNDLLEFQNGQSASALSRGIRSHLAACEFCSAEVEFYSRYPQDEVPNENVELSGIPAPLYELAEALLKKRDTDASSLDALLKKKLSEPAT